MEEDTYFYVIVEKCSNPQSWYNDFVGRIFLVHEPEREYDYEEVYVTAGRFARIFKEDCRKVQFLSFGNYVTLKEIKDDWLYL